MNVYGHVLRAADQSAADKFESVLELQSDTDTLDKGHRDKDSE